MPTGQSPCARSASRRVGERPRQPSAASTCGDGLHTQDSSSGPITSATAHGEYPWPTSFSCSCISNCSAVGLGTPSQAKSNTTSACDASALNTSNSSPGRWKQPGSRWRWTRNSVVMSRMPSALVLPMRPRMAASMFLSATTQSRSSVTGPRWQAIHPDRRRLSNSGALGARHRRLPWCLWKVSS